MRHSRNCGGAARWRRAGETPEHGAGVSVNRMFRNTGGVAPGERLTLAHLHAVEQEAIAQGIYKGVAFRPFPGAISDPDLPEFAARAGIGTDFALQFARSVFVPGYPVTGAMLDRS